MITRIVPALCPFRFSKRPSSAQASLQASTRCLICCVPSTPTCCCLAHWPSAVCDCPYFSPIVLLACFLASPIEMPAGGRHIEMPAGGKRMSSLPRIQYAQATVQRPPQLGAQCVLAVSRCGRMTVCLLCLLTGLFTQAGINASVPVVARQQQDVSDLSAIPNGRWVVFCVVSNGHQGNRTSDASIMLSQSIEYVTRTPCLDSMVLLVACLNTCACPMQYVLCGADAGHPKCASGKKSGPHDGEQPVCPELIRLSLPSTACLCAWDCGVCEGCYCGVGPVLLQICGQSAKALIGTSNHCVHVCWGQWDMWNGNWGLCGVNFMGSAESEVRGLG